MIYRSPSNFNMSNSSFYPYNQYYRTAVDNYKMKLLGVGTVKAIPNIAVVNLGVVTENKDLRAAREENSKKTNEIIKTLKKMDIQEKDIKTQSFSITPVYDYIEGKKIFRGYRVTNTLEVTIRNIDKTGEIIDASVDAGSNVLSNIRFTVNDPDKYYRQALNLAIINAIEKAKSIEYTLKIEVNKIPTEIIEENSGYVPMVQSSYMETERTVTPIEPGILEFNAKVEATFSYKY